MPDPAPPGSEATASDTASEFLDTTITRPRTGTAVLEVEGEVDTLTAPRFSSAVDELMSSHEPTLVVDLSGVTFLASSGLAVLIQAAHRAEERSARLRLVAATRAVRRPLEITGTDQLFDMHENVHDAAGGDD
ncbi:STAS domain-containing protein [Pseudonocardia xinjiangensis]|uniref:STAS domain-containing protein n=1 Tax=Pseudonocardia xinjiangensis TaxID=75289 RepID=UPI003D8AB483